MNASKSAIILIGYQNDYFSKNGILTNLVEDTSKKLNVLSNTTQLIQNINEEILIISTPIIFSEDYSELLEPIGILKIIKDSNAFKLGTTGSETIKELKQFENRIIEIPGKHGLNAFIGTELEKVLLENEIKTIILAGCVCSICIDSTGRAAFDKNFEVIMLSDCITGRTLFEQDFYCKEVFPLYSKVMNSIELISALDEK